jgi:hypothetical protein
MLLEQALQVKVAPPEVVPGYLGCLIVHLLVGGHGGVATQGSLRARCSKVSDDALKLEGDKPVEHQGVMAPEGVMPHLLVQDVQEVLGHMCKSTNTYNYIR